MNEYYCIDNSRRRKRTIIFGLVLAFCVVLYNLIWLNRTFTFSEVWFEYCNSLMKEGKLPYKDFYFYVPPFNILIHSLFYKISGEYFIIYRFLRLFERIILIEFIYYLFCDKIKPSSLSIIVFFSSVFAFSCPWDLIGDYSQTAFLFVVIIVNLLKKYIFSVDRKAYLILVGFIGCLLFFTKQTYFTSAFICFMLYFIILSSIIKAIKFKDVFYVIISGFVILFISVIILNYAGIFIPFIKQTYLNSDGKGSLLGIIVIRQLELFKKYWVIICFILFFFLGNYIEYYTDIDLSKKIKILSIVYSIGLFLVGAKYGSYLYSFFMTYKFFLIFIIIPSIIFIFRFFDIIKIYIPICLALFTLVLIKNPYGLTQALYSSDYFILFRKDFPTFIYIYLCIWIVYSIFLHFNSKKKFDSFDLLISLASVCVGYSEVMTSGEQSISLFHMCFMFPAFVYINSKMSVNFNNTSKNNKIFHDIYYSIGLISLLTMYCICLCSKLNSLYLWWGFDGGDFWSKTEKSNIECLKGFRFSEKEIFEFQEIAHLIDYYSDEDTVIYGYPYIKIYNCILNNYNDNCFVPIHFYDVSSYDYIIKDLDVLKNNEPDIVVWLDIEGCISCHEELYRNGELLGQREIVNWFCDVKDEDYILIGQIDNLFVYKLNTDDCDYFLIDDENAHNATGNNENL